MARKHMTTAIPNARGRLLSDLPVVEERRDLNGTPTAVLEGGDGPPMVLLHGAGEFAATWMRAIPELAKEHRLVIPDLPGHGDSALPEGELDADGTLRWLDELIEATCASPPVLVGHLLGGGLAARYAVEHSDKISHLVLVDTFGLGRQRPSLRFGVALLRFIVRPTTRTQDALFRQCMVDFDGVRDAMGQSWEPMSAYALDRSHSPDQKVAIRKLMSAFGGRIDAADLANITVPTTLIWGRHDRQVRLRLAQMSSDRFGWPLHVIDGVGDDPVAERPDVFVRTLRRAVAL